MQNIITWINAHWSNIFAVIGAAVTFATVVVKITPSQKDDAILAKVVAFLNWFSTVNPKAPKT
jgi:hypothetical protein